MIHYNSTIIIIIWCSHNSKGNVKVSYVVCACYCHDHPLCCEQTNTNGNPLLKVTTV